MSNQTQSLTQRKRLDLGKEYVKSDLQRNNLLVRQPQAIKISTKNN